MKRLTAILLFTLFNLGAFGVSIEQHFCCHAQQEECTSDGCNDDDNCCDEKEGCCNEIVSQVKISKDYNSQQSKQVVQFKVLDVPNFHKFYSPFTADIAESNAPIAVVVNEPPRKKFQLLYSTFLI